MFLTRSSHFKVVTDLPELVNKRIQQIYFNLREIQYVNRSSFLLAKGSIRREIIFQEFDGRLRKLEDRLQFELVLGEALSEPLPFFKTELKEDYFVFQPRHIGEEQATLEQGFTLSAQIIKVKPSLQGEVKELLVNSIVNQGSDCIILEIAVPFPEQLVVPRQFVGVVNFITQKTESLIEGELRGVVSYRLPDNLLREIDLVHPFTILPENKLPTGLGELVVRGDLADISWVQSKNNNLSGSQQWIMKIKINYEWFLVDSNELKCLLKSTTTSQGAESSRMRTATVVKKLKLVIPQIFQLAIVGEPTEIKLGLREKQEQITQKGLLLNGIIVVDVYVRDPSGIEKYHSYELEYHQLITEFSELVTITGLLAIAQVAAKIIRYQVLEPGQLQLDLQLDCEINLYQKILADVITTTTDAKPVLAEVLVGGKMFTIFGASNLLLRNLPHRVEYVKAEIAKLDWNIKNGWLQLQGQLEVAVSYSSQSNQQHCDVFQIFFEDSLIWSDLTEIMNLEINCRLDYDSYSVQDHNINYQYLLEVEGEIFQEQVLKIAIHQEDPVVIQHQNTRIQRYQPGMRLEQWRDPGVAGLIMEGEVPLQLGLIREIASSRSFLTGFNYRKAHNAILIEGDLNSEIEYWDEDGFLRRELVRFPFWRFVNFHSESLTDSAQIIPEIGKSDFKPVSSWPWQKSGLKIKFELNICIDDGGDVDESIIAKSDQLFNNSGRRYHPTAKNKRIFSKNRDSSSNLQ